MAHYSSHEQQPGLEVSHQNYQYSTLEHAPAQVHQEKEPIPLSAYVPYADHQQAVHAPSNPKWRQKKFLIIGAVVAIAIIGLAVGLGVGLTTGKNKEGSGGASSGSAAAPNMTGTATVDTAYLYPTPVSWGYPHLEVLSLTTNTTYSIYRKSRYTNATSDTDFTPSGQATDLVGGSIDTKIATSIAVRARSGQSNRTDLIVTDRSNSIYYKSHGSDENWSGDANDTRVDNANHWKWIPFPPAVSSPTVVDSYTPDVLDLFVLANGTRTTIHHSKKAGESGDWSKYEDLGGPDMMFAPAAVSWGGDRIDVFGVARATNHLLHTSWDGKQWATFSDGVATLEDLGGHLTSPPIAVSRSNGTIDVFARGGDGGMWVLSYDGSWGDWAQVGAGTAIRGQPEAISWDGNRIDVFGWASADGALLHATYDAGSKAWSPKEGFDNIGSSLYGPPKAVSDQKGRMHVFAYDRRNMLIWKTWTQEDGWGSDVSLAQIPT